MDAIKEFFKLNDKFGQYIGVEIEDVCEGYCKARMPVKYCHLNGAKVVHGGVIFTLADLAFAAAVNAHGRVAVAASASITFVNGARLDDVLTATAVENHLGHKMASYEVKVTDQNDKLIATFNGLAYRKEISLEQFLENDKS